MLVRTPLTFLLVASLTPMPTPVSANTHLNRSCPFSPVLRHQALVAPLVSMRMPWAKLRSCAVRRQAVEVLDFAIADVGLAAPTHDQVNARIVALARRGHYLAEVFGFEGYEVHVIGNEDDEFIDPATQMRGHAGGLSTVGGNQPTRRLWIAKGTTLKSVKKTLEVLAHEREELKAWVTFTEWLQRKGFVKRPESDQKLPSIRKWAANHQIYTRSIWQEYHQHGEQAAATVSLKARLALRGAPELVELAWRDGGREALLYYVGRYGTHAAYYLLHAMARAGYRVGPRSFSPITTSMSGFREAANAVLGEKLFASAKLSGPLFFEARARLREVDKMGDLNRYGGVEGMLRLNQLLANRYGADKASLSCLYEAFGTPQGFKALFGREGSLGWESLDFPWARLIKTAHEIQRDLGQYRGFEGMVRMLKWLDDEGETTNASQLKRTFGTPERLGAITKIVTGQELIESNESWGWENIGMPYDRLVLATAEIRRDPDEYAGLEGMLRLARWLADRGEATNLAQLFLAFGDVNRLRTLTDLLTGVPVQKSPSEWGWKRIDMPYERLVMIAKEILRKPETYRGTVGMIRLAKWLSKRNVETNPGDLFAAFGPIDRLRAITKIAADQELSVADEFWQWKPVDITYKALVLSATLIASDPPRYRGVSGMVRLAKTLFEKGQDIHLGQLYSAFGRVDRLNAVTQILAGKAVVEKQAAWGWMVINMRYTRVAMVAGEIARDPNRYRKVTGMLRLVRWLADQDKPVRPSFLYAAFGTVERLHAVTEMITGRGIVIRDKAWAWDSIDFSYNRLVRAAFEIARDPNRYAGVTGMIRLAQWLSLSGGELYLGHLYSAFGSVQRLAAVTSILAGKRIVVGKATWNWSYVRLSYRALVKAGEKIAEKPTDYRGVAGMVMLARQLSNGRQSVDLASLHNAFGDPRSLPDVIALLTGKAFYDGSPAMNWERIELLLAEFDRRVDAAPFGDPSEAQIIRAILTGKHSQQAWPEPAWQKMKAFILDLRASTSGVRPYHNGIKQAA